MTGQKTRWVFARTFRVCGTGHRAERCGRSRGSAEPRRPPRDSIGDPFDFEEERPRAEQSRHGQRPEARVVDHEEPRVFARPEVQVDRFPEERVVDAQAVRTRRHLARGFLAE